jgi:PAS domain S-box-containing protein
MGADSESDTERRLHADLTQIYDTVQDVLFSLAVEPDGYRFVSANRAFFTATGLTEPQVVGKTVQQVIPEPSLSLVLGHYRRAMETGKPQSWEEETPYPAGVRTGVVTAAPVFDPQGKCTNLIGTVHDITDWKESQRRILELNQTLESRVAARTAELEAANKELEAFSYSVSHDLRAPLRAIDGFARILAEDYGPSLDTEGLRLLGVVIDNSRKMGQLIDDLLAFSRLGRREMEIRPLAMGDLVQAAWSEVLQGEGERRVRFTAGPLPPAQGDPALVSQVWKNLLSNALKYTRGRPEAVIEVLADGGVYAVKDNGVGFDMAYADKLFGVFQRLHSAQEYEGTGIGLSLVKRIVGRHGGEVWAQGRVDGGATFSFTLPGTGGTHG